MKKCQLKSNIEHFYLIICTFVGIIFCYPTNSSMEFLLCSLTWFPFFFFISRVYLFESIAIINEFKVCSNRHGLHMKRIDILYHIEKKVVTCWEIWVLIIQSAQSKFKFFLFVCVFFALFSVSSLKKLNAAIIISTMHEYILNLHAQLP